MTHWSPRGVAALFLAFWVALAPAMFAGPAAAMLVQTNLSDDGVPGGCDACPDGDAARGICKVMCLNATPLATIAEPDGPGADLGPMHRPGLHPAMLGRLSTPDPAPPKTVSHL